jgi:hypothetical protein
MRSSTTMRVASSSRRGSGHWRMSRSTDRIREFVLTLLFEGWCVAILHISANRQLPYADVVIYSFHYLLDPKVAEQVSKEMSKESIVVFDEAHNIGTSECHAMI